MSLTTKSKERLATCHPDLQALVLEVAQFTELTVLCGHRNQVDQEAAVKAGNSKAPWPTSKHNSVPSKAVDLAPLPLDWNDIDAFKRLATTVKAAALYLGIEIRWGGDFKSFKDYPHFELTED